MIEQNIFNHKSKWLPISSRNFIAFNGSISEKLSALSNFSSIASIVKFNQSKHFSMSDKINIQI